MSRLTGALTKKYIKKDFEPFLNVIKSLEERRDLKLDLIQSHSSSI